MPCAEEYVGLAGFEGIMWVGGVLWRKASNEEPKHGAVTVVCPPNK